MTVARIRVAAVDDHALLLRGISAYLADGHDDLELVAVAAGVDGLLAAGAAPDVVLLDLHLQDGSEPAENVARLVSSGAAVLLFTTEHRAGPIRRALDAGATGLVLKEDSPQGVADALRQAARGEFVLSSQLALQIVDDPAGRVPLTDREREVLDLLARGLPWDAVAKALGMSIETARTHLRRVATKYAERGVAIRNGPREVVFRAVADGHLTTED